MVRRLLVAVASPVAEHGLWSADAVLEAHAHSYCAAHGIVPDQGSNLCLLHWQAHSYPLSHQGSPSSEFFSSLREHPVRMLVTTVLHFCSLLLKS